ncbi:MAG: glycosyltransferase family 2 protein [Methylophaga sp.]|nr:glycosyltransferase family 2 protein [Methylophaga sp.]
MKNSYTLSVIMPVYNGDKYLCEAIDSVLCQSYSNFEFIIINDGSTDKSSQIIRDYAKKDARIKVIDQDNRGLIYSLNQGINQSSSEIIARMDADDICHPERFKMQLDYLEKNPNVVALGSLVNLIDSEGDTISDFNRNTSHSEIDKQHMRGVGGGIVHPSAMIRRSALLQVGLYDDLFPHAEDLDLWLKLAEIGELANISECLLRYRQHSESIGHTKRALQRKSVADAVQAAFERRCIPFDRSIMKINPDILSEFDAHLKWAWWAYKFGNNKTARKHALKAFLLNPWNTKVIKILIISILNKTTHTR